MLRRFVLLVAITMVAVPAVAQDATDSWSDVKISDLLSTATVLDESGALWSGEVVRLNADGLDLVQANGEERHFTVAQVRRLETTGKCGGRVVPYERLEPEGLVKGHGGVKGRCYTSRDGSQTTAM